MSYELGTINCDVPAELDFAALSRRKAQKDELKRKLAHLELFRIIARLGLDQQTEEKADLATSSAAEIPLLVDPVFLQFEKEETIFALFSCDAEQVSYFLQLSYIV